MTEAHRMFKAGLFTELARALSKHGHKCEPRDVQAIVNGVAPLSHATERAIRKVIGDDAAQAAIAAANSTGQEVPSERVLGQALWRHLCGQFAAACNKTMAELAAGAKFTHVDGDWIGRIVLSYAEPPVLLATAIGKLTPIPATAWRPNRAAAPTAAPSRSPLQQILAGEPVDIGHLFA